MTLLRALLNPGVYAGAIIALLLVATAYQVRPSYDVPFGSATDGPLLRGFNAGEEVPGASGSTFRWSTGDASITLQDFGRQDFDVLLRVNGSRPAGEPPPVLTVTVGSRVLVADRPAPGPHDYAFVVPRELVNSGTLTLHLQADTFTPPGDPRQLGIIVERLGVVPGANPDRIIEPPLEASGSVALAALILGIALSLFGWGMGGTATAGTLVGLLAAWLLVSDRLWLTSERWYGVWPGVLLGGALFAGAVGVAGGWLFRRAQVPWHPWQRRALLALMMVVFAVRLAGQLHPQIFIVDLNFHAHRFETVQSGQLLFTIRSAEWGGHETFYLPTAYVFMLPLQWVAHDELLVIKLFTVAASTLGGFVVYYVARRALRDGWAGLIAAALYLLLPIAVLPFSWGITTNIFGELFALLSLAIVVTGYHDLHPTRPALWGLLFCLLMALLSHPGVVQLTLVAFTFISLLWFFAGRIIGGRRLSLAVLGTLALAFGVAFAVYYSNFAESMFKTLQQIQAERASSSTGGLHLKIGGSVADKSLGLVVRFVDNRRDWLLGGLRGFWQEAQGYYQVWPVAGALLGYVAAWPGREPLRRMYLVPERISEKARLVIAAGGWSLTVALFALVGWAMNLYVRYALFALPVVAIGAGYLLSRVARRGHSGVWLSALVLAYFGAQALALWGYRITYAFK